MALALFRNESDQRINCPIRTNTQRFCLARAVHYQPAPHHPGTRQEPSFIVETVLSSDKYRQRVLNARAIGFSVTMVYVTLRSPELAVKRVKQRFENGGHGVPEDKIRE